MPPSARNTPRTGAEHQHPRAHTSRGSDGADALAGTGPRPRWGVRIGESCGSRHQPQRDPRCANATRHAVLDDLATAVERCLELAARPVTGGDSLAAGCRQLPPLRVRIFVLSSSPARDRRSRVSLPTTMDQSLHLVVEIGCETRYGRRGGGCPHARGASFYRSFVRPPQQSSRLSHSGIFGNTASV